MPSTSPSLSDDLGSPRVLVRCLFRHALRDPQKPAVHDLDSGNPVGWRTLAGRVLQIAEQLRAAGVRAHQSVGVAISNRSEALMVSLAIQQLGAIEAALGTGLSESELLARVQQVDAPLLIVDSGAVACRIKQDLQQAGERSLRVVAIAAIDAPAGQRVSTADLETASRACDRLDPNATALILWTSGTQSHPRGAMLSHHALTSNAAGKLQAVPQDVSDRRLTVLPLYHAYARTCDMGTWLLSGSTLAVTWGWEGLLKAAPRVQPTLINMVPSLAVKLLRQLDAASDPRRALARLGLANLRLLGCGGAPLAADDFVAFRELGIVAIHGYGLTEAGPVVCSATPAEAKPGTVGRPIPGVRIRIDSEGKLWTRGPGVMQGYWGDPEASAKKCVDGWLDTGDLALLEEGGQVTILGRADDTLVLANGRKLQPFAIEQACCRLPGIRHAVLCVDAARLVLLVDGEDSAARLENIRKALTRFPAWQQPDQVVRLHCPLSYEQDELTAKGTVRRGKVIEGWHRERQRQRGGRRRWFRSVR